MRIRKSFEGVKKIFIDTAPIIYFIEAHPLYGPLMREIVDMFSNGILIAYTSVITLTEVLVKPVQLNKMDLAETFEKFLLRSKGLSILDIDVDIASYAGILRGKYKFLRTLDALQLSAAIKVGADVFITNDRKLKSFEGIKILYLNDFVRER